MLFHPVEIERSRHTNAWKKLVEKYQNSAGGLSGMNLDTWRDSENSETLFTVAPIDTDKLLSLRSLIFDSRIFLREQKMVFILARVQDALDSAIIIIGIHMAKKENKIGSNRVSWSERGWSPLCMFVFVVYYIRTWISYVNVKNYSCFLNNVILVIHGSFSEEESFLSSLTTSANFYYLILVVFLKLYFITKVEEIGGVRETNTFDHFIKKVSQFPQKSIQI